jgi:hypothetical protein
MKKVSSSTFENWTPQPSESTSDSGRGSLMDDKHEGRLSFKTSDVVKNEVHDVIDGDRRLTVREVADNALYQRQRYMRISNITFN